MFNMTKNAGDNDNDPNIPTQYMPCLRPLTEATTSFPRPE